MNPWKDMKVKMVVPPQEVDDTGAEGIIDTFGFEYAVIDVYLGAAQKTNPLTELKILEANALDTGSLPGTAEVVANGAASEGAGVTFLFPAIGDDGVAGQVIRFRLPIKGKRKRYLGVSVKSTTDRAVCIAATLCESLWGVGDAADEGVDTLVEV